MAKLHITSKILIFAGVLYAIATIVGTLFAFDNYEHFSAGQFAGALIMSAVDVIFRLGACIGMVSIIEYLRKLTEQGQTNE